VYRQEVIQYLRRQLEQAGGIQRGMVEIRLDREREKEASLLYMSKGATPASPSSYHGAEGVRTEQLQGDSEGGPDLEQLSPEQLQLFEKENSSMLKHYTDQLDQVKNVQATLYSIAELQTQLVTNLVEQQDNVELLARDAELTEDNVGRGNTQLKKASERRSTARMVFYSTCVLCSTLVVWDLIF
jgi:syntaxin 18